MTSRRIVNRFDARPVNGSQTHGARLATGIDNTPGQLMTLTQTAGFPYSHYLRMGGGIAVRRNPVARFGNNLAVLHYHGCKRPAATGGAVTGQLNTAL